MNTLKSANFKCITVMFDVLIVTNVTHRRTQDFTMEGVHVVGAGSGGLGDGSPQWGPAQRQSPSREPGTFPPEA